MTYLKTKFRNLLAAPEMLRLYIASGYWVAVSIISILAVITPPPLKVLFFTIAGALMFSCYAVFFPVIVFFTIRAVRKGQGDRVNNIVTLLLTVPGGCILCCCY
ncbi:MAG: hypothetical protein ACH346_07770 [Chthoniobacterales bacterium]